MSNVQVTNGQGNEPELEDTDEVAKEDIVDPRVQVELERLNTATDLINKLEIELDEARSNFRLLLSESSIRVNQLAKKLGSCVEKARPYYEARMRAKQLQTQTQKAALRYERASSAHSAAKEMVYLAEEGLKKEGRCFDPAWQEMLNHATLRVNEAESERVLSQREHQKTSLAYNESEKIVQQLHQELKKSIVKSSLSTRRSLLQLNNLANQHQLQLLPYFEMKAQFNELLEEQRKKVHHLEENVLKMKMSYADALHNLEEISDEIHQQRKSQEKQMQHERSEGVGAEFPNNTWESVKPSYHKFKSNSLSSENIYLEHIHSEDTYMSLPPSLKLTPGIVATSCMGNHSDAEFFKSSKRRSSHPEDGSSQKTSPKSSSNAVVLCKDKINGLPGESETSIKSSDINSKNIAKHLEQLRLSNENYDNVNKVTEVRDAYPEGEEMTDHTHKYLAPDFNILRVQREELSDSESLASNDTADTLDDNQIECLLLEKSLPFDIQEQYEESSLTSYKAKKLSL